jgi:hypothetical protein
VRRNGRGQHNPIAVLEPDLAGTRPENLCGVFQNESADLCLTEDRPKPVAESVDEGRFFVAFKYL